MTICELPLIGTQIRGSKAMQLVPHFKSIARDNRGATAIEYGLILAMVFLAMVGAVTAFGGENGSMYDEVSSTAVEAMQATV